MFSLPHIIVLSSFLSYTTATCWFPDGKTIADTYITCNTTKNEAQSACCDAGDPCSTNGFCMGNAGFAYRGGCTDSTWESPSCAKVCKSGEHSHMREREIRCVTAYTTKPHRIVSAISFHARSTTAASQKRSAVEHGKAAKTQKQDAATRVSSSLIKVELEDSSTPRNSSKPPLLSPLRQPRLRHQLRKPRAAQLPRP